MTNTIRFSSALFTMTESRIEKRLPDTHSQMLAQTSNHFSTSRGGVWEFPDTPAGDAAQKQAAKSLIDAGQPIVSLPYYARNLELRDNPDLRQGHFNASMVPHSSQMGDYLSYWAHQSNQALDSKL